MKNKIVSVVSMILSLLLVFGLVAAVLQVFTPYKPSDWFKKGDVVVDEPVVEEVLPLVATTEEEMNSLLIEENVGRIVTYTGEDVWTKGSPFVVGEEIFVLYFNTAIEPSFSGMTWEYNSSNGGLESVPFVLSIGHISIFPYELSSMGLEEGYALMVVNIPVYSSVVFPAGSFGDLGPGWIDWDVEAVLIEQGVFSFGTALVVQDVRNQDLFSSFISKEPFEILYENNVEYQICKNDDNSGYYFEIVV